MRTPPQHDRAALVHDAATLRGCADRLEQLTTGLPPGHGPDWAAILASLARRCRAAAGDLDRAAALYPTPDPAGSGRRHEGP
jgi:hypothetical protein